VATIKVDCITRLQPASPNQFRTNNWQLAGKPANEYDDVYLHNTFVGKQRTNVRGYRTCFAKQHQLPRPFTTQPQAPEWNALFLLMAIHLCDSDTQQTAWNKASAISFLRPTSNLFSSVAGLFKLSKAEEHKVNVGLGTDVGGGTSFTMVADHERSIQSHSVCRKTKNLNPIKFTYLSTLGGA